MASFRCPKRNAMKKQWFPFWLWEDYQNGMFEAIDESMIPECVALLSDQPRFYRSATRMVSHWTISAAENLTNKHCNRNAWIGQATCCFELKATERTTKAAWAIMAVDDKIEANCTARRIIDEYSAKYRAIHQRVGDSVLFGRNTGRD